jgi:hypothetical protein
MIVFEQRHPHFERGSVNCDFSFHKWDSLLMPIRRGCTMVHRFTLRADNLCEDHTTGSYEACPTTASKRD